MRNYMQKLRDELTELGYTISNIESKSLFSDFSFEVNGNKIRVTNRQLKDVDGVVEYVINHVDKEEKMKTVTETLKALVQDLDEIDNVVFGEHTGTILINSLKNITITMDDFKEDGITVRILVDETTKEEITSRVYKELLEFIKSYLNDTNELDAIGAELVSYLNLDDYEIDHSMIKITLPNNREMKIECVQENIYNIAYQTKQKIYGSSGAIDEMDTWYYTHIKTDNIKNLAKIIVLKYIYNF